MGTQEFVDDHFSRVLDYHGDLRDAIVRMGEEYPVEAMRMMQVVAGRRFHSYLRVTDSGYTRRIAERVDAEIIDAVSHIIHVRADPSERPVIVDRQDGRAWREREHHEQRMMLGAGHGGLGFTCGEHEADALHFASWAATLGSMITRFGVSDEEGGTASLRRAAQELERVESSDLGWASRLRALSDDVRAAVDEDPLEGLAGVSREFYDMISPRKSVIEAAGT